MGKTGIEYGDYGWNFYPGCLHKSQGKCPPVFTCWAGGMAIRRPDIWGDFHKPHLIPELLLDPLKIKKPSRILVNFMGDLFGDWVEPDSLIVLPVEESSAWIDTVSLKNYIYQIIEHCPQHTFIFLTKNPAGLIKWSPFPDNCWVGVSVTANGDMANAYYGLNGIKVGKRFLSFEPLLGDVGINDNVNMKSWVDWLIIGQQTPVRKSTMPRIEWIKEIVEAADRAKIPIFLKENLGLPKYSCEGGMPFYKKNSVLLGTMELRQEFPQESRR